MNSHRSRNLIAEVIWNEFRIWLSVLHRQLCSNAWIIGARTWPRKLRLWTEYAKATVIYIIPWYPSKSCLQLPKNDACARSCTHTQTEKKRCVAQQTLLTELLSQTFVLCFQLDQLSWNEWMNPEWLQFIQIVDKNLTCKLWRLTVSNDSTARRYELSF